MADNLRIAIRLVADGSAFVGDVRLARDEIDRLGNAAGAAGAALDGHGRAVGRLGNEMDALSARSRAVQEAQSGVARTMGMLTSAALAMGASLSVGRLIEYADSWKSVESRLKLVTGGTAELRSTQEQLFAVAQRTRQSFDATADTFARFARATQGIGTSNADLLRVVETINQAVAVSGGSAASAEAALFQLGQAMASGALRGDELNSVLEQTPRLAEAIAAGMGRSTGELRALAEQGKLTSDAVLKALLNQGAAVAREFGQIAPTVASSVTTLQNAVQKYIGEADQAHGVTTTLAAGIETLAQNLPTAVRGVEALGVVVASVFAARTIVPWVAGAAQAVTASTQAAGAAKALAAETLAASEAAAQAAARRVADVSSMQAHIGGLKEQVVRQRDAATAQMELTKGMAEATGRTGPYLKALEERNNQTRTLLSYQRLERGLVQEAVEATNAKTAADIVASQAQGVYAAAVTRTTLAARAAAAAQTAWNASLAFIGGPIGAAILVTAAAVTYFATRQSAAEKAAHDHADALRQVGSSADALELKLTKVGGALTNVEKLQAKAKLTQAEENMAATRGSLGTANSSTGLLGRWAAIGIQASNEIEEIGRKFAGAAFNADGYADELAKLANRHADNKSLLIFVADLLRTIDAYKAAEVDAKKYRNVLDDVASSTNAGEASFSRFTNKLGELGGKLSDIAEKARVLQALPGLPRRLEELVGAPPPMVEGVTGYTDRHGTTQDEPTQRYEANKEVAGLYLKRLTKAEADEQIRLLGEQVKAEGEYQKAVSSGNALEIARAAAKKKVAEAIAAGFPVDQKAALLAKETELALLGVSGAAGAAATELDAATTATMRLAQAAGAGEAAQRAATYANKEAEASLKGNIALSAVRAANAQDEAAAILTIRNETVRGLELETANTNALTTAMAAGGEAVRVAQEQEYKLALIRKLGADATVTGTKAQKALNDAMDAYRNNRAANDNSRLTQAKQTANDNLALAQRELDLMGEAEPVRQRAITSLQNQQEAARKVAELGEDGARQWLAWQEQIADKRAYVDFLKSVQATAKEISGDISEALYDRLMDPSKATSVVDVFKAIFKRIAVAALETNIVLPIVTQIVGAMPSVFGITAPAAGAGAAGATTAGPATGGLTSSASNWAMSKAGGWAMDKMGLSSGMNNLMNTPLWGSAVSMSSTGAAAYGGTLVANPGLYGPGLVQAGSLNAANGVVNAGNTAALNASYSGTTTGAAGTAGGTLGGILGSAGAGAFGGMLGGMAGTATNSKVVGGISGAALGAGAGYLSSLLGLGAMGGPIGLAIAAVVGGIMGMLSTQKKSVGPNAAGNLYVDQYGAKSGPAAGDNGMDGSGMSAITDGVAQAINTIVGGVGGSYKKGLPEQNLGHITYFQEGDKWSLQNMAGGDAVGEKQTFNSQEELVQGLIRQTLQRMDKAGSVTGFNEDVRTALRNSKATKAEDLATDVVFAGGFRKDFDAMAASLNPVNNQIKEFTAGAKEIGQQIKTNLLDWSAKAKELGLATDAELVPAMRNGLMAMMGLGPVVQPLRGLDAVTKQAEINLETLRPALAAVGYTATEQADIAARYIAKAREDYLTGVNLIQAQGDTAIAALLDPSARLSATTRMTASGFDMTATGMKGLGQTIDAVELAARAGTLTTGDLTFALGQIDEQWRSGVLTAEQYNASIQTISQAWQNSIAIANAMRQGNSAIDVAIDPKRKPTAAAILADAGIADTASGVAGFSTQLGAFLTVARAGKATAADLTYTHGQLQRLLASGAITTQQYQTVLTSLTGAYTDATTAAATTAATIRTGSASVAALVDPTRKPGAADILADAGIDAASAGVAGFSTQLGAFLTTARAGKATAADLTYTYGVLERLLTSGVITGEQYSTVLGNITSEWTSGKSTAEQNRTRIDQEAGKTWTDAVTKAAQEVGDTWRTAANAARQAAADWTRVGDGMQQALDSLLVNNDLSNLGPTAMLDTTEKQFTDAAQVLMDYQAKLQLGGRAPSEEERQAAVDAAGQMDALGQRYLEEARAYGLGAVEYQRRLEQVQGLWSSTRDMARSLATAETSRAQGLDRQIDWLSRINDTMNGTGAASARLLEDIKGELIAGRVPASTPTTGAYTNFLTQLSTMQRGLSAADTAAGRPLGYTDYNSLRGQYLNAEQSSLSGATADELRKAYDAAKGVSAVVTQIVIDQMRAKGVSVSWADQFRTMFAAYAENDATIRQRGGSDEQTAGNLQYWVGVRDRLAQDIPTSELLALLGQGSTIEPNSPDTWDLRVKYWLHQRGVPGFERGGQHVGGARVVGERGAELEVTGPARYWTHEQTRDILSPKSVSVTVDLAPVVTAIGGVTSAVMDIGRLIQDLSARVANVEDAIRDLSGSHGQLATQIRKLASR